MSRDYRDETIRSDLTPACKRALVILLEDETIIRATKFWSGRSNREVYIKTIEALYERYLIKIVVESRHRRRHTAVLTNIGEYAAKEIQRELASAHHTTPHVIFEQAARFISEVVG